MLPLKNLPPVANLGSIPHPIIELALFTIVPLIPVLLLERTPFTYILTADESAFPTKLYQVLIRRVPVVEKVKVPLLFT